MGSIKSELTKGVFWIALAKYSGIIVSLLITAILARHISPAAFGTMAIATVIMAFLDIFSDMGLGVAIVQFKDLTKCNIRSLFTVSILLAICLTVILFLCSGIVAQYYNDPILDNVIKWLCICLFFKSLDIVPNGLMLKNKRFRDIAIRTLIFQVISGGIASWMALTGWGIYALLGSPILSSFGIFIFNFCNYPQRPAWPMDMTVIRRVWSYSMYQFLFSIINFFSRNADTLIIGKSFSMIELGYYEKSYKLMQLPLQKITFVITPVLHPILSSIQDNKEELFAKNSHLTKILSWVSFPLGVFLFFTAEPIVLIVFGDKWLPAIPVFRILSLSVPLQVMLSTSGSLFQAAGQTKHLFYCGLQSSICTVGAFIIAAIFFRTIEAMAWAWVIAACCNFVFTYWWMNRFTFHTSSMKFFRQFFPQLINSLITAFIIYWIIIIWNPHQIVVSLLWNLSLTVGITLLFATLFRQYSIKVIWSNLKYRIFSPKGVSI